MLYSQLLEEMIENQGKKNLKLEMGWIFSNEN